MRVLGRVVVGDQLEFGDGIDRRVHFRVVGEIAARQRDAVVIDLIVERSAAADMLFPRAARSDARGQENERRGIADAAAERERQIEETLVVDHGADVGGFGLDHRGVGGDFQRLRHLTDTKGNIDLRLLIDLYLYAAQVLALKAGGLRLQRVDADGQVEKGKRAVLLRDRGVFQIGARRSSDAVTRCRSRPRWGP